jgi:hypothetical protein
MPGRKYIIVIFDDEHPLKPKPKVCDNRYGKSIVNKPVNVWQWMAKFAGCNYDEPCEAAGYKPPVK